MLKCVPCEDPNHKVFSYQEVYGVHIVKLEYKKFVFFNNDNLQWTKLMPAQKAKIDQYKESGFAMINGFKIFGKVFSDPNDNSSGTYVQETNVIIIAKEGLRGAIVVLPTGEVLSVSSKSWKPTQEHFKV